MTLPVVSASWEVSLCSRSWKPHHKLTALQPAKAQQAPVCPRACQVFFMVSIAQPFLFKMGLILEEIWNKNNNSGHLKELINIEGLDINLLRKWNSWIFTSVCLVVLQTESPQTCHSERTDKKREEKTPRNFLKRSANMLQQPDCKNTGAKKRKIDTAWDECF